MEVLTPTCVLAPMNQHERVIESETSPHFDLGLSKEQRDALLLERLVSPCHVPGLHLDTVQYRRGPNQAQKSSFRQRLMDAFGQHWTNSQTAYRFSKMLQALDDNGATLMAGIVKPGQFERLIERYEGLQKKAGNQTFLHSYINLADHEDFLTDDAFNDAFLHPLFIALIAHRMGGAVRINDVRGKDTDAISVNAQDNMLHIDNTPFRDEFKTLLCWQRGKPQGPSGQNLTFIPGTHKGNRDILLNDNQEPWSTERDSLFVTEAALDEIFKFQHQVTGRSPTVVEAEIPDCPVTAVFTAGSIVHHRYRTEHGDPRSCIITAFHVAEDNPGALVTSRDTFWKPSSLVDLLIGPQDEDYESSFLAKLVFEAVRIEQKISDLFARNHTSGIVDIEQLVLDDSRLAAWRAAIMNAPSASTIKFKRGIYLSEALKRRTMEDTADALATVMSFDKHGLLQLILYEDGREEIRKIARKRIGEMKHDQLASRLLLWLPAISMKSFSKADIPSPLELRLLAERVGQVADAKLKREDLSEGEAVPERRTMMRSLRRLLYDLGEALVRCEKLETYISTSLFLFWARFSDESQEHSRTLSAIVSAPGSITSNGNHLVTFLSPPSLYLVAFNILATKLAVGFFTRLRRATLSSVG